MTEKQAANIIRYVSVMFFFTALIFASGAFAPIDGASVFLHDLLDWPLDGGTAEYTKEARWFSAIGGGVFAGLCVLFLHGGRAAGGTGLAPCLAGRYRRHAGLVRD